MEFEKKVPIGAVEETVQTLTIELGQQILQGVIGVLDACIAQNAPSNWRNVGTEKR